MSLTLRFSCPPPPREPSPGPPQPPHHQQPLLPKTLPAPCPQLSTAHRPLSLSKMPIPWDDFQTMNFEAPVLSPAGLSLEPSRPHHHLLRCRFSSSSRPCLVSCPISSAPAPSPCPSPPPSALGQSPLPLPAPRAAASPDHCHCPCPLPQPPSAPWAGLPPFPQDSLPRLASRPSHPRPRAPHPPNLDRQCPPRHRPPHQTPKPSIQHRHLPQCHQRSRHHAALMESHSVPARPRTNAPAPAARVRRDGTRWLRVPAALGLRSDNTFPLLQAPRALAMQLARARMYARDAERAKGLHGPSARKSGLIRLCACQRWTACSRDMQQGIWPQQGMPGQHQATHP